MTVDVIVPCLNRPQNAQPLVDSLAASEADAQVTFVCTGGDRAQITACEATGANVLIVGWPAKHGDYAKKINHGFAHTSNDFILMGADDIAFQKDWDTIALRAAQDTIGVVATNDKANRQVMRGEFGTHCLIRRSYILEEGGTGDNQPGVVLYEGYSHNFVDRELCDVARSRGRYAFASRSVVRHRHPLWRTAAWDPTYRKALERFRQDQALFASRSGLWTPSKRDSIVR